jgi:Predicted permease
MNFIQNLFTTQNVTSTLLFLCVTAFLGIMLGKLEFKKIRLGVAGVLFSGIFIAHLGAPIDEHLLHFIRDFGLILFVYSIGVSIGPRFFSTFKKDGLLLNVLALGVIFSSSLIAYLIYYITDLSPAVIVGILCGAVTNTPSLGAVQQFMVEQGGEMAAMESQTGMSYALAYPFGIIGVILTMLLIRLLFRINTKSEVNDYTESLGSNDTKLQSVEITVINPNLFGKDIHFVKHFINKELAISRIIRNGESIIAIDEETVQQGDIICGVSTQNTIEKIQFKIGTVEIMKNRDDISGPLGIINILLTNQKLAGKTIEQIGIYRRYPANVTRIFRSGMKILPTMETTLELGDTVKVVGKKEVLNDIKKELGNSVNELAKPNIISIFLGIFTGIILGSIPISIPGVPVPVKLGLAGGPLLVAILLGYKGRIGKLNFYMTPGANLFMREIGIILFLSCIGLLSGEKFVDTFLNGGWQWTLYGSVITFIPLVVVASIARILKVNYLKICGCLAGATTCPPALEFANSIAPAQAQAAAYASVYPLTMFLRIIIAQLFILMLA